MRYFHPKASLDSQVPIKTYITQTESEISSIHPTQIICEVRDLSIYDGHALSLYQFQKVMLQVSCQLRSWKRSYDSETNLFCPQRFFFQVLDYNYMKENKKTHETTPTVWRNYRQQFRVTDQSHMPLIYIWNIAEHIQKAIIGRFMVSWKAGCTVFRQTSTFRRTTSRKYEGSVSYSAHEMHA